MRWSLRSTLILAAALMLAGCDQQAQKASSDAIPDAGSAKSGGVAVITEWKTTDQTGRIVIPPQFDEAGSFSDGLAAVRIGARFGYIDKQGKIVIKPQFSSAGAFSDGLAVVGIDDKWGYIDKQGKFVIKPQFSSAGSFSDGLAAVRTGDFLTGKSGFIDSRGNFVIKPQ